MERVSWVDSVLALDSSAFLAINGMHAAWLDPIMVGISEMLVWVPLYLFFLYLIHRHFGSRALALALPVVALMILCSDKGSVLLFKEVFQRLRPCHEAALQGLVHTVNEHCGGRYGFVSSHASNHFAIAAFMGLLLRPVHRYAVPALLLWALVVSYSRIYLGVHYPGDVLVGALFGAAVGVIFFGIFSRLWLRHARAGNS